MKESVDSVTADPFIQALRNIKDLVDGGKNKAVADPNDIGNFIQLLDDGSFNNVTAIFTDSHRNGPGVKVVGYPLSNGNWIFANKDGDFVRLVLANSIGEQIKSGYLRKPGTTWTIPST